mgnify:CR=1 FL=1
METRVAAINFIKSLSESDKVKIKSMLSHGIICGADFARQNELNPAVFSEELKLVFGGK